MEKKEHRNESQKKEKRSRTQDPYGDEGRLTHYLGNDEYLQGNNEPAADAYDNPKLDGYEALGNELSGEEIEALEREKHLKKNELDKRFSLHRDE